MPWDTKAEFDQFYSSIAEVWGHPNTRPPIRLNYNWFPIGQYQRNVYAQRLFNLLGLSSGSNVVLVGCGFNETGAGLAALGVNVIGTDTSGYIDTAKTGTEEQEIRDACAAVGVDPDADSVIGPAGTLVNPLDLFMEGGRAAPATRGKGEIMNQELKNKGSRNAVINRFQQLYPGLVPDWIISEEVLNSITDAQADLVCSYMDAARDEWGVGIQICHMLSPLQTDKTQDPALNWKTYADWRTFLNANGWTAHQILPTVTAENQGLTIPASNPAGVVTAYSELF